MAKGEITPRADDTFLDAAAVAQVFDQVDLDRLKTVTATLCRGLQPFWQRFAGSGARRRVFRQLNLDRVQQIVARRLRRCWKAWSNAAIPRLVEVAPEAQEE